MTRIENPIATTENCRYCLMCRHMCPVGHLTHLESLTPHGWGLTIASVARGQLQWNAGAVANLYACADCGNCRSHCVTDQPLPTAIAAARADVVAAQLAPPVVGELERHLGRWGNPYEARPPEKMAPTGETALFAGDNLPYLWPTMLDAVHQLVAALNLDVTLVALGRNNGQLPSALGLPGVAARLAEATLSEVRELGAPRLVVLTPGDYFTLHQLYIERLGLAWPSDVAIVELVTLLADAHTRGELAITAVDAPPTAYVDPTHAPRVPGRHASPRQLLTAVLGAPPIELFFRAERAHPCGDGALHFTHPGLAEQLTRARLADARNRGARVVVTEDPACLWHLTQFAPDYDLIVRGLYEQLAHALAKT